MAGKCGRIESRLYSMIPWWNYCMKTHFHIDLISIQRVLHGDMMELMAWLDNDSDSEKLVRVASVISKQVTEVTFDMVYHCLK